MGNAQQTPPCVSLAREALQRHPELAKGRDVKSAISRLAEMCQEFGESRFRLLFGLRPPDNEAEQIAVDCSLGRLSIQQAEDALASEATRPIDGRMLNTLFEALDARLVTYSKFVSELNILQSTGRLADWRVVEKTIAALSQKLPLCVDELRTLHQFLTEARIDRQLGRVQNGRFDAASASDLVGIVCKYVVDAWQACAKTATLQADSLGDLTTATAHQFVKRHLEGLPLARTLQSMIYEEHAAARLVLRERSGPNPSSTAPRSEPSSTSCISATTPQGTVSIDAIGEEQEASKRKLLQVHSWSDLAIGIDERSHYWAFTPVPEPASVVTKRDGIQLRLRGKRWKSLLSEFASSSDGRTATIGEICRQLGYLPMGKPDRSDNRARSGETERAHRSEIGSQTNPAHKRLETAIRDLRRQLREFVAGPADQGSQPMEVVGNSIMSQFVVRFLVPDVHRSLHFGEPRET